MPELPHQSELRSRVFRAVCAVEVLVTVSPGRTIKIADDGLLALDTDDGERGRVDFDAMVRDGVRDHDAGPHLWTMPGESSVGAIEELTPDA